MSPAKKLWLILVVCAVLLGTTSFVNPLIRLISAAVGAVPVPWVGREIAIAESNNTEYEPDAAFNWKHNEYLVVWRGHDGIYGRRVSATGKLLGHSPFPIATGPRTRRLPSAAYDPVNDRYLVVWMYDKDDAEDWNINGRFIPWESPDGSLKEFEIFGSFLYEEQPKAAYSSAQKEFLVVFVKKEPAKNKSEIWGTRVRASDGKILGTGIPFFISDNTAFSDHPDVAYNQKRNEYLVTWDVQKASLDVYGARLTGDGQILNPGIFSIAGWPNNEGIPAAAACPDEDQYLVVWQSEKSATNNDIYARVVFGDAVNSATVHHVADTVLHDSYPDTACSHNGRQFLVTWQQQYSSTSGPYGIIGRFVNTETGGGSSLCPGCSAAPAKTASIGDVFGIMVPTASDASRTRPAASGGFGEYLVAWEHLPKGTTDMDVHGKKVMPGAKFLPVVIKK